MTYSMTWFLERRWSTLLVGIDLKTKPTLENTVEMEAEDDSALYEALLTGSAKHPPGKCIGYGHLGSNNWTNRVDSSDRSIMCPECPFGAHCPIGGQCGHRHDRMSTQWHPAEPYSSPKSRVPAKKQIAEYFQAAMDSELHVDKDKASLVYNADWSEFPDNVLHMFSAVGLKMYNDMFPYMMHPIGLRAYAMNWLSAPLKYYLDELLARAKAMHCTIEDALMRRREAETLPENQMTRQDKSEIMMQGHGNLSEPGYWTRNSRTRFGSFPGGNWKETRCPWSTDDGGNAPKTTRRRMDFFYDGLTPRTALLVRSSETPATAPRRRSVIDSERRAPANQNRVTSSGQHIYGSQRSRPSNTQPYVPTPPPPPVRSHENEGEEYAAWGQRSWPAGSSKDGGQKGADWEQRW